MMPILQKLSDQPAYKEVANQIFLPDFSYAGYHFGTSQLPEIKDKIILAGGGRKNKTLIKFLSKLLNASVESIDQYKLAGDFIESQAFAYLAIRSLEQKHLSLPTTTGVSEPVTGGIVYSN